MNVGLRLNQALITKNKKQNPRLMEEVGDLILMNKGNFINPKKQLNSQV